MALDANKTPIQASAASFGGDSVGEAAGVRVHRHPLGRLITIVPLSRPVIGRLRAAGIAAAAGLVLVAAAELVPSADHLGTHRQFGLPPCGFVLATGLPCPTCGMTTAYAYTVRGQFIEALRSQVAGFILALATAGAGIVAVASTVTGLRPALNWYRVGPTRLVWWLSALFVAAWAVKIVLALADGSLPAK